MAYASLSSPTALLPVTSGSSFRLAYPPRGPLAAGIRLFEVHPTPSVRTPLTRLAPDGAKLRLHVKMGIFYRRVLVSVRSTWDHVRTASHPNGGPDRLTRSGQRHWRRAAELDSDRRAVGGHAFPEWFDFRIRNGELAIETDEDRSELVDAAATATRIPVGAGRTNLWRVCVPPENLDRSKLEVRSLPSAPSGARRSDEEVQVHGRADRLRAAAG